MGLPQWRTTAGIQAQPAVDDSTIPQAIVDAESRSASGRPIRLGVAALAALSAAFEVAGVTLNEEDVPLVIDNVPISVGLSCAVLVGAAALASSEYSTMRANQQRIWDEFKKRREAEPPNRMSRRSKKSAAPKQAVAEQPSNAVEAVIDAAARYFPEADAMARVQATQLNTALEERGILEPVAGVKSPEEATQVMRALRGSRRLILDPRPPLSPRIIVPCNK